MNLNPKTEMIPLTLSTLFTGVGIVFSSNHFAGWTLIGVGLGGFIAVTIRHFVIQPKASNLQQRALKLCSDLQDFKRKIGPLPPVSQNEMGKWVDKQSHGFVLEYKERVTRIAHEFMQRSLYDPRVNAALNNTLDTPEALDHLIEGLAALSAKITQREALRSA